MHGVIPRSALDIQLKQPVQIKYKSQREAYVMWKDKLEQARTVATEYIHKARETQKQQYDKHARGHLFKVNDPVLLKKNVIDPDESRKLRVHFEDGFQIMKFISPTNVQLLNTKTGDLHPRTVHVDKLKYIRSRPHLDAYRDMPNEVETQGRGQRIEAEPTILEPKVSKPVDDEPNIPIPGTKEQLHVIPTVPQYKPIDTDAVMRRSLQDVRVNESSRHKDSDNVNPEVVDNSQGEDTPVENDSDGHVSDHDTPIDDSDEVRSTGGPVDIMEGNDDMENIENEDNINDNDKTSDQESGFNPVEKVYRKRDINEGNSEYYVKWKGYGKKHNAWVKASDLTPTLQEKLKTRKLPSSKPENIDIIEDQIPMEETDPTSDSETTANVEHINTTFHKCSCIQT
jgi:hypothetical protein